LAVGGRGRPPRLPCPTESPRADTGVRPYVGLRIEGNRCDMTSRIAAHKSANLRPATGFIRKVLFDTIAAHVPGAAFLDLFAGTGSVGLEALQRGAASATFVEKDRAVARALRSSIEAAGVAEGCRVFAIDAVSFLRRRTDPSEFDIIFAGPPYERGYLKMLVHILFCPERLPTRVLVIQTSKFELAQVKLPDAFPIRQKRIGDTVLLITERQKEK